MKSKLISLVLVFSLLTNIVVTPVAVLAQETEPTPTTETTDTQTTETTTIPETTPSTEPVSIEPVTTPTSTSTPTPTIPPYSSKEYDEYKKIKNQLDDEREAREDVWEENEEDKAWVASHGGNEEYYVSGLWQKDEDARKLAEEQARLQAQQNQTQSSTEVSVSPVQEAPSIPETCVPTNPDVAASLSSDPWESESINSAVSENHDSQNISTNNCATVTNNDTAGGVSGQNSSSGNDGVVSMGTGNVNASGQQQVNANGNVANTNSQSQGFTSSTSNDSLAQDGTAENLSTGEDSDNLAQTSNSNDLTVNNNNTALVDNELDVDGVSGSNTVVNNDGSATLTTGDIELIANMLNILNLNVTGEDFLHLIVNIFGELNGTLDLDDIATYLGYEDEEALEIIAQNQNTGEDSNNTANSTVENNTNVTNNNTAVVNNDLDVSAISGANNVSGNDGDVNVITGRIEVLANVLNFINTNMTGDKWKFIMINIFGSLNGNIILPGTDDFLNGTGGASATNSSPGEDSSNNQSATSTDQTTVNNNNNVTLNNSVNAYGDSGNNSQNDNDDEGHSLQTGVTDISSQIMNFLNMNLTGNNFVFLVVNVFGKWMGQIVGFADNGVINGPGSGTFAALAVGGNGGEGSTNDANASSTNNTNITNNNNAIVNNNINVEGISGQNGVNGNDGATSLTTGWVEIDANLLNIINTNITGNSWMVVFLNVFGDFMGDMFFGRENVPALAATGGQSETHTNNSNSSSQSSSHNLQSQSQGHTLAATKAKTPKVSGVLSSSSDNFEEGNDPAVYEGYYIEQDYSSESAASAEQGGLLSQITLFLYSIYKQVRGIVEPMLAKVNSLILLS